MQVVLHYRQPKEEQGFLTFKVISDDFKSTLLEGDFQSYYSLRQLSNILTGTTDGYDQGIFTPNPARVTLHKEGGSFIKFCSVGTFDVEDPASVMEYILSMLGLVKFKFQEKYPLKDIICSFTVPNPY